MLYQLLHQNKAKPNHVELISQHEYVNVEAYRNWMEDTFQEFPLPEGCQWLCCDETSPFFVRAVEEIGK
jgi:hypothetical protein